MNERDVILRERAAVNAAINWIFAQVRVKGGIEGVDARQYVEEVHPFPKVIQLRVVTDPHIAGAAWRIVDGRVQYRDRAGGEWQSTERMGMCNGQPTAFSPTPQRIKIWADLLAQPTETVDA